MPHCIVEYSTDLEERFNPSVLVDLVYQGAFSSKLFEGPDIKIRALPYVYYQTGERKQAFIHVSIRLLEGRTQDKKMKLSNLVLEKLTLLDLEQTSLTVEIIDIERASYAKKLVEDTFL
ncbi:5-carboxymethyl-2-hydroxymuconate Delta-isomerase [Shewanella sp. VB17]|uniref:5-carboxymethyl-2-hydroxymuconate Delta-isomerase n=1 Tax=Shewanella sp. VB17 TaxID=2739432 RepID=UPI001564473F|nr:5-carboxymethyl-2-hydroxymuconate Delta-isomerase [Shewanella sp. VB17]NRD72451.1 5-carboxymethyl-2-hydroxymuconate Delta-isomerase [Shewanella sp. VB17]